MSGDIYSSELEETSRIFAKAPTAKLNSKRFSRKINKKYKVSDDDDDDETEVERSRPLFRRLSRLQSALRPNLRRFRNSFRKLNCTKNNEEEELPMIEVPRHKSIDIARRVSMFLFTRRTVCVHPYHPYTPEQTTRKLYFCFDDKQVEKQNKNNRDLRLTRQKLE